MAMAQVLRAGQTAPSNRYSETRAPGFSGGTGDPASGNIIRTPPSFRPTPAPAIAKPTPNVGAPPTPTPAAPTLAQEQANQYTPPALSHESPFQSAPPPQLAPETPPQSPPTTPFTPAPAQPEPSPLATPLPSPIQSAPPPPAIPETRLGGIEPPATMQTTSQPTSPTFSDPYYALMFGSQPMGGPTSFRPGA